MSIQGRQVSGIDAHEQIFKRHARVMCNKSCGITIDYIIKDGSLKCKEFLLRNRSTNVILRERRARPWLSPCDFIHTQKHPYQSISFIDCSQHDIHDDHYHRLQEIFKSLRIQCGDEPWLASSFSAYIISVVLWWGPSFFFQGIFPLKMIIVVNKLPIIAPREREKGILHLSPT